MLLVASAYDIRYADLFTFAAEVGSSLLTACIDAALVGRQGRSAVLLVPCRMICALGPNSACCVKG